MVCTIGGQIISNKDLLLTAGLYAGFVGLALFGWWQWKQIEQKQLQAS